MNRSNAQTTTSGGRFHWGSYGFLAGMLVGILMGWMFAGFVGALIRVALFALVVIPIILLYLAWRRYVAPWLRPPAPAAPISPAAAIETTAVIGGVVREPQAR